MRKIIFILLITHYSSLISDSQVSQEWVARYNGPGNGLDYPYSIAVDAVGNVYVTGQSEDIITSYDYATIKYSSSGVEQWVARFNDNLNGSDGALSIAIDASGNVYVTGWSLLDYMTIKYSSSGNPQWFQRYNGPGGGQDYAHSIAVDALGNVYVTGESLGSSTGLDYATIKYNTNGILQWVQRYNGPGNSTDAANCLVIDTSGNIYVTGQSSGSGTGLDYATIKYNSFGVQQWVARYNGLRDSTDASMSIAVNTSGNVWVTGYSFGNGTNFDYATIKYNSSGVQQWVQRYNGSGNGYDNAVSLAVDTPGNVYVTGRSYEGTVTRYDYATIKYDSFGVQQWVARYNGPGDSTDGAYYLAIDTSANIYVAGLSEGIGTSWDYATIKYNSSGVQQWVQRYNGPSNSSDKAHAITVDVSGNIYVTGASLGSGTYYDYATIKYSQSIGIQPISNEIPEHFGLFQNYPNPFNANTKFRFQISRLALIRIKVYDILGSEIVSLVDEKLSPGVYEVQWDASDYPSGVYVYRLTVGDASTPLSMTEAKKMILIK